MEGKIKRNSYLSFSWMSSNYDLIDVKNTKELYTNLSENSVFTDTDKIENIDIFRLFYNGTEPMLMINGTINLNNMYFVLNINNLLLKFLYEFESRIKPHLKLVEDHTDYVMHFVIFDNNEYVFYKIKSYNIELSEINKTCKDKITIFSFDNKFIKNYKNYISNCIVSLAYIDGKFEDYSIEKLIERLK